MNKSELSVFSEHPGVSFDLSCLDGRSEWVIGLDEVGRGCLAGPVLAVACRIRIANARLSGVKDSKLLTALQREFLVEQLAALPSLEYSYGVASVEEIDQVNIGKASLLAMERALHGLDVRDACILVDGKSLPYLSEQSGHLSLRSYVKGDSLSWTIGAASIFAKVKRDAIMCDLEGRWPGYSFSKNKGYGTAEHLLALKTIGVSPVHRRSFKPVRETIAFFSGAKL
ncbi:ribonuclease HII [Candidatus Similichlamydia laticola]|uniref:Ribonuclease HII n=1 Tax=Candidatus Similichlamydia laticola TaxID=2170265 RepID=A0A369KCT6_9BACT|nr:ribonuclease HII [Candidatus Similichlamydia laticola]RDB31412.1 Ribonuclease HII [Candidatus Similichlamydia laticola]